MPVAVRRRNRDSAPAGVAAAVGTAETFIQENFDFCFLRHLSRRLSTEDMSVIHR